MLHCLISDCGGSSSIASHGKVSCISLDALMPVKLNECKILTGLQVLLFNIVVSLEMSVKTALVSHSIIEVESILWLYQYESD